MCVCVGVWVGGCMYVTVELCPYLVTIKHTCRVLPTLGLKTTTICTVTTTKV